MNKVSRSRLLEVRTQTGQTDTQIDATEVGKHHHTAAFADDKISLMVCDRYGNYIPMY